MADVVWLVAGLVFVVVGVGALSWLYAREVRGESEG